MQRSVPTCATPLRACSRRSAPGEECVVRLRFGIGTIADHTLAEVGRQFAVSRERIRQIEAKALRKLRHPSRSKRLQALTDV